MAHSNKNYRFIFTIVLTITSLCLIGGFSYIKHKQEEIRIEQIRIKSEKIQKSRQEINKLFDLYLNDFKYELEKAAKSYKSSRKVLKEILSPDNFETPKHTKESYDFFNNYIAPDLRSKSIEIISIFQKYKHKLTKDILDKNSEIKDIFLSQWEEMSHDQLNSYINFFEKEELLIQAYEKLIKFYYIHSNLFSYDAENNTLLFDREKDKAKEHNLRKKMNMLQ